MAKKPYIPTRNAAKIPWAENFNTEIATDGPTLGATAGEVTAMQTASQGIVDEVNAIAAAKAAYEAAVEGATTRLKGHIKIIRNNVKRMKSHSAYTTEIGQNLGIIGDEQTIDEGTSKPVLDISKVPSGYNIDFNLLDHFHGLHIYRKRPVEADFSLKATDNSSPYIDTDAQVNGTQYFGIFIMNDQEIGLPSDIVTIQV